METSNITKVNAIMKSHRSRTDVICNVDLLTPALVALHLDRLTDVHDIDLVLKTQHEASFLKYSVRIEKYENLLILCFLNPSRSSLVSSKVQSAC